MTLLYDYGDLGANWTIYQKRPPNFNDNPNREPDRNIQLSYADPQWSVTTPAHLTATIPFTFEAAVIGPNSHIGSVVITAPGKKPFLLTVGAPLIGSFDANSIMSASRIFAPGAGGYLEVIFYPRIPSTTLPTRRANYTRFISNGQANYAKTTDPDFVVAIPYLIVCDGRKRMTLMHTPAAADGVFVQFLIGSAFSFDEPLSVAINFAIGTINDTNTITSISAPYIIVDIPPGTQAVQLMNRTNNLPYAVANMTYLASFDD